MKDLKHLLFFETLLDDADNELIKQAKAEGGRAVGYTCYHIPEPLLKRRFGAALQHRGRHAWV